MNSLEFYKETINQLNICKVKYLVVGGYAVNSYGFMRSTGDMDLWIDNAERNLDNLYDALINLNYPDEAVQAGIKHLKENRNINLKHKEFFKVELISLLSTSLSFDEAYSRKSIKSIFDLKVCVVDFDDLCNLKLKSGRNKDLLDVKELRKLRGQD